MADGTPITKAMILAAGQGLRLRPLTERVPKCMVAVRGRPILEHTILWLRRHGVTDIMINLWHLPEAVTGYFGDGSRWEVSIRYSIEEQALGTAGGVRNVAWFFDGPFFVWYADNLSTCDLTRLLRFHRQKGGLATIALYHRDDPTHSGIVALEENDRVARFLEKPRPDQVFSRWVNAGIYLLDSGIIDLIPTEGIPDFGRDVFPSLVDRGRAVYGYRMGPDEGLWWIDTPEDLRRVQEQERTKE